MSDRKRKVCLYCPICEKVHEVEERTHPVTITVKGKNVIYEEVSFFCPETKEEENEFYTQTILNENIMRACKSYSELKKN